MWIQMVLVPLLSRKAQFLARMASNQSVMFQTLVSDKEADEFSVRV